MDGKGMRNENGKDKKKGNHGNSGVMERYKIDGNHVENGIKNYGIGGGNIYNNNV